MFSLFLFIFAAVCNLLSNLHITLLQSIDSLHTAHTMMQ
jgi:hypothetical protein